MKNSLELIKNTKEDFEAVPDGEKEEYKERLQEEAVELNQIDSTNGFKAALEGGVPEAAESFLNDIKNNVEKFPKYKKLLDEKPEEYTRMVDHGEREVIKKYKEAGKWYAAKKIIENSINVNSKVGRMEQLAKEAGMKYDDIKENM